MTPAAIESMTTINIPIHGRDDLVVRIWRTEDSVREVYNNEDILSYVFGERTLRPYSKIKLADAILEMPRVSAVEVKDATGNGIVVYREWP